MERAASFSSRGVADLGDANRFGVPCANDDGNPIQDGTNTYVYNAETRLIGATTLSGSDRVLFTYDYTGRRVRSRVESGSSPNWKLTSDTRYA